MAACSSTSAQERALVRLHGYKHIVMEEPFSFDRHIVELLILLFGVVPLCSV